VAAHPDVIAHMNTGATVWVPLRHGPPRRTTSPPRNATARQARVGARLLRDRHTRPSRVNAAHLARTVARARSSSRTGDASTYARDRGGRHRRTRRRPPNQAGRAASSGAHDTARHSRRRRPSLTATRPSRDAPFSSSAKKGHPCARHPDPEPVLAGHAPLTLPGKTMHPTAHRGSPDGRLPPIDES
jgi:hypothetical protein